MKLNKILALGFTILIQSQFAFSLSSLDIYDQITVEPLISVGLQCPIDNGVVNFKACKSVLECDPNAFILPLGGKPGKVSGLICFLQIEPDVETDKTIESSQNLLSILEGESQATFDYDHIFKCKGNDGYYHVIGYGNSSSGPDVDPNGQGCNGANTAWEACAEKRIESNL